MHDLETDLMLGLTTRAADVVRIEFVSGISLHGHGVRSADLDEASMPYSICHHRRSPAYTTDWDALPIVTAGETCGDHHHST